MTATVRLALAALLVLTGASAAATLTESPATPHRTVVQADEPCTPPECLTLPPRDPATQRQVDALTEVYTAAFATLKTTTAPEETHS